MLFLIKNVSVSFTFTIQREQETGSRLLPSLWIYETLLAMHAGWSGSQRLVSIVHLHTQKNPSGKCIYHAEYGIVIQHKDAAKPLFQNLNTLLFKASENSGATYWGVEHLWFNKFSEYHGLTCFLVCLYFFHLRTLPGLTIMLMQKYSLSSSTL